MHELKLPVFRDTQLVRGNYFRKWAKIPVKFPETKAREASLGS